MTGAAGRMVLVVVAGLMLVLTYLLRGSTPDAALHDRGPDLQGPQQIVAPAELLFRNGVSPQRAVGFEHIVDLSFQLGAQRGGKTLQLEIYP